MQEDIIEIPQNNGNIYFLTMVLNLSLFFMWIMPIPTLDQVLSSKLITFISFALLILFFF